MIVEALTRFFRHQSIKRVLALLVFAAGLVPQGHLAALLVFALIIAHSFGFSTQKLEGITPLFAKA